MSGLPPHVKLQVPLTHPMFAGHFPDHPVVPGAWLLAQAIRALQATIGASFAWQHVVSAKFHTAVPPGACLDLTVTQSSPSGLQLTILQGSTAAASVRFGPDREPAP
jgi:3-hydroxymyristoyl/3-hydroxydecanoyl-(acyl carrier protein) dehydratase